MNIKRNIIVTGLLLSSLFAGAVPAKRGLWRQVRLADGTEVKVQLMGDENMHYYADADRNLYQVDPQGICRPVKEADLRQAYARSKARRPMPARMTPNRLGKVDKGIFQGTQRGLIILVEFQDTKFGAGHDQALYQRIANERGFRYGNFQGSLQDYFHDQSFGQFTLNFDVVGPVTMSHEAAYYGGNGPDNNDLRPGEMAAEACKAVEGQVNFADYDWDKDGMADQVYFLYAGMGEADGTNAAATIWPHAWNLSESDYGKTLTIGGVKIDRYACSNEINGDGEIEGIGIICHEFSHCMGFPDTYDILYTGNFGMGNWDLMDAGAYAGNTFVPIGYTAYERMTVGWKEPVELLGDTVVNGMKASIGGGDTYIIYNKAYPDEYYLLENRRQTGWDTYVPGEGMLVTHVDFDSTLWANNVVNAVGDFTAYGLPGITNDHQRLTILHADNDDDSGYFSVNGMTKWKTTEETDAYPCLQNDSIGNNSVPAATLYHRNLNGRRLLNVTVGDILINRDGTVSFTFKDRSQQADTTNAEEGVIFYESFNACEGKGGNDGIFGGGEVGTADFDADNDGWDGPAMSGADKCVKSGTNKKSGSMTTPVINLNGEAELTFLAAPFGSDTPTLTLAGSAGVTFSKSEFALTADQWTACTATLSGNGPVRITFVPAKRMLLDEVKIKTDIADGIATHITGNSADLPIYNLQGVRMNAGKLPKGIYIRGNKKIVVR